MEELIEKSEASKCSWDLQDTLEVFTFYFFMLALGTPMLIHFVHRVLGMNLAGALGHNMVVLLFSLLTNLLACGYIFFVVSVRRKQPLAALGLRVFDWKGDLKQALGRYLMVLPLIMAVGLAVNLLSRQLGLIPQTQEMTRRFLEEKSSTIVLFMLVFGSLLAPMAEEVLFRGFLQPVVKGVLGSRRAILVTALLFALVHLNIYIFFQIFILGILLGYLYERTGSLLAPVTVHTLHNSVTLAYLLFCKGMLNDRSMF